MSGVPQDVLSQLFALLSFVSDPSVRLISTLIAYALVPVPVLLLLRRLSLIHGYRLHSLRFAFRRIGRTLRRRPRQAMDAAVRVVEETGANPVTAVLCWAAATGLSVWWWLSAIAVFDDASARADLGQRRPVMFGVPLSPTVRWSVDGDHLVLLVLVLCFVATPVLAGRRVRMVHARLTRQRGRSVPPWYADVRFVLGFSAGLLVVIIGDWLLWTRVALLVAVAVEVGLSAVLLRAVRLEAVPEPSWVGQLTAPPPRSANAASGGPRRLGLPWRPLPDRAADPGPSSAGERPAEVAAPVVAPVSPTARLTSAYRKLFTRPDPAAASRLRGPAPAAGPTPTRVFEPVPHPIADPAQDATTTTVPPADSWAGHAPPLAPLTDGDPRRIGAYAIQGRLGSGGMSVVYAGRHRSTRREVAVKVMRDVLDDADAQARLLREMEALAEATGPYTVKIITVGNAGSRPSGAHSTGARSTGARGVGHFLVMERLLGPNLWDFVHRSGPITDPGALTHLAVVLAAGLSDFHGRAVTHRDLKPANVMLTEHGPVIVDLGIARLADVTATMPGSQGFATLGYVAPETILGRGTMAPADVWSWGCCLAYAASGQRLFPGEQWEAVTYAILNGRRNSAAMEALHRVSPPLADLVWTATDPDPQRRPFNGSALLTRLPSGTRWPSPSVALGAAARVG